MLEEHEKKVIFYSLFTEESIMG